MSYDGLNSRSKVPAEISVNVFCETSLSILWFSFFSVCSDSWRNNSPGWKSSDLGELLSIALKSVVIFFLQLIELILMQFLFVRKKLVIGLAYTWKIEKDSKRRRQLEYLKSNKCFPMLKLFSLPNSFSLNSIYFISHKTSCWSYCYAKRIQS